MLIILRSIYYNFKMDLTWNNFYDKEPEKYKNIEKNVFGFCTSDGIEKHLLTHLNSAALCNLDGRITTRDSLISGFTYDLCLAFLLDIKLDNNLFSDGIESLINSDYDYSRNANVCGFPHIYQIPKKDYINSITDLFELPVYKNLQAKANLLGQDNPILHLGLDNFSFPLSRFESFRDEKNPGNGDMSFAFPLACVPAFITSSGLEDFFNYDISQDFEVSELSDLKGLFTFFRNEYLLKLTGLENPSQKEIGLAIKTQKSFNEFILDDTD